jgi:hypothetical protein
MHYGYVACAGTGGLEDPSRWARLLSELNAQAEAAHSNHQQQGNSQVSGVNNSACVTCYACLAALVLNTSSKVCCCCGLLTSSHSAQH